MDMPPSQDVNGWTALQVASPRTDSQLDELHEPSSEIGILSPKTGASGPLFDLGESQVGFPYSQWQTQGGELSDSLKEQAQAEHDSLDEEEVEAEILSQKISRPATTYRKLTDIASQPSTFSAPILPTKSSTKRNHLKDLYGRGYDEQSETDSDNSETGADEGASHIPQVRRAGLKFRNSQHASVKGGR
jgi:hypothetical protein